MKKMKDSGIEWLGDIPENWNTLCHKRFMTKVKDICEKWDQEDVLSLTVNGVVKRDLDNPKGKMPATFDGYQFVYPGNLLLCLFDIDVTPRCAGKIDDYGVTSPAYSQYALSEGFDVGYYTYYFIALDDQKLLLHLTPTMRSSFNADEFAKIFAIAPPLSEQVEIAKYLDAQCQKIDLSIDAAEKSIEEYKAYKRSVIFETVTKGLDPDTLMKDSGIEWLGSIPSSWGIAPIKTMFNIKKNIAGKLGYDVLSVTQHGLKIKDLTDMKGQHSSDYSKYQLVNPGDFVMNHMDLLTGWIDISEFFGVTSPDYRVFTLTDNACARYYLYVFQTYYNARVFYGNGKGISGKGRWRLPKPEFLNLAIPIPPLDQQEQISQFLDTQSRVIDSAIQAKQSIIEELKAYKKSLIYEVVTGKREIDDR